MQSFDVVIVGGGMVGLALACGLRNFAMKIAIIENNPPQNKLDIHQIHQIPSVRVSAINAASQKLFEHLGVWQIIKKKRVSYYQYMDVWQQNSFTHIHFDAKEFYLAALGYVIENSIIRESLWQLAELSTNITFLTKNKLKKIVWGENEVFMALDNEMMFTAKLVVGADGSKSWLREKANIPLNFWNYEHTALIATIRTEFSHMQTAYQFFYDDSILAFLPLYDPYLCSIVWSLPVMQAHRYLNLDISTFEKELSTVFNLRLGFCWLISKRYIFPLTGQYARSFAGQRIVLIGDAAHTIHPLAGQGVNLGLMDVAELIGQIKLLNATDKDIGQYFYLRSYERKRKYSAVLMLASIHGLRRLFNGDNLIKKIFCDVGLLLVDKTPCMKAKLLHYALGLYDMPEWLAKFIIDSSS